MVDKLHIVFDGPPGHEAGRFVECETPDGKSVNAGEWVERPDGLWELRIACFAIAQKRVNELEERVRTLEFHVAQRGAALAPFAEACSNCIDDEPDNGSTWEHPVGMEVTFRDFRDARDVLDLPSAALPTPEVPGESEEEMK